MDRAIGCLCAAGMVALDSAASGRWTTVPKSNSLLNEDTWERLLCLCHQLLIVSSCTRTVVGLAGVSCAGEFSCSSDIVPPALCVGRGLASEWKGFLALPLLVVTFA